MDVQEAGIPAGDRSGEPKEGPAHSGGSPDGAAPEPAAKSFADKRRTTET